MRGGGVVVGFKLGLTSKVKRDALGIHEPVYGRLTSNMLVPAGQPVALTASSTRGPSRRSRC